MSISLLLNEYAAPATFAVGTEYSLTFAVNGEPPLRARWSIGRRAEAPRSGIDRIIFKPDSAEPYYLHVETLTVEGDIDETIFVLSVTATGQSADRVVVTWSDPQPRSGQELSASISCSAPPRSIGWSLRLNNVPVEAGSSTAVTIPVVQPGIYRLVATVIDSSGNTVVAESSIAVQTPFGLQTAIVPAQPTGTLQYLGEVYSPLIVGEAVKTSYLPYELVSLTHSIRLVPGTTHYQVDLDPVNSTVDDEVVIRTPHGNWTVKGPPTGLTAESLPYDYQHNLPYLPAPLDLNARFTAEVWNVHGSTAEAHSFRLRIRCYQNGLSIYRYTPCDWSAYYGGEGERQRRMVGLITRVETTLDAEWPNNRWGSRDVEVFTVPDQQLILGQLTSTGRPDRPGYSDDHFYTDQNAIARYESEDGTLRDLVVNCAYGLPSARPCYLDFSQPAKPRIIQKLKRLSGQLVLYVSGGAFSAGTTITVRIYTGKRPSYVDVTVPVTTDVYNPDYTRYARVGAVAIDISDFEFERVGVLMDFAVNEAAAATGTASYEPLHQVAEDYFYSRVNSPAVRVDTACFRDPVRMTVFDGTAAGSAVPLPDCNRLACGPVGLYCYTLVGGAETAHIPQPLGFPAPYVAYTDDQTRCFFNPLFLHEITAESAGSHATFGYSGTTGCGVGYEYTACNNSRSLAVIYPQAASPHSTVSFGGTCWGLSGSISDLRPFQVVAVADVSAVASCTDVACTGSNPAGSSVLYLDQESGEAVSVQFHHLDAGVPAFGAAPEHFSTGHGLTPPGAMRYAVRNQPSIPIFTQSETAQVSVEVDPPHIWRDLVVLRSGTRHHYPLIPGIRSKTLQLQAGDSVFLEFANHFNRYRDTNGEVRWQRIVDVPRVYHTVEFSFSGSQAITAVGFTGLTNRQDYAFYGTLPADVEMDLPNPDSVVTVQDGTLAEMLLVRTQAVNENRFFFHKPAYAGQRLGSPVTFRFYAGRSRAGQHGEMDVWLEDDQSFPSYLKVSPYQVLTYGAYSYRKTSQFGDATRRGLRVTTSGDAATIRVPRVYRDDRGERISVRSASEYVLLQDQPYVSSGTLDTGLSEVIHGNLAELGEPSLVTTYPLVGAPSGVAYVPLTNEVWAATSSGLSIVDADASPGVTNIATTAFSAVAWCAATSEVIFAATDGTLAAYNPVTRTVTKTGSIGATGGFDVYVVVVGTVIYVGAYASSLAQLFRVNSADLSVIGSHSTGSGVTVEGLVYVTTTGQLLLGTESGGSFLFDRQALTFTNLGIANTTMLGFADSPDRQSIYGTSGAVPGAVIEVDPVTKAVLNSFSVGNSVRNPFWHPLRKKLYYGRFVTNTVEVIDPGGNLLTSLSAGGWTYASAYVPAHRYLYTSVRSTNQLRVYS